MLGPTVSMINAGAPWTPRRLSPTIWAENGFVGSPVSQWTDLGGLGNHLVQSNAAWYPSFQPTAVNGRPGLEFDGTKKYVHKSGLSISAPYTIGVVGKLTSQAAVHPLFGKTASPSTSAPLLYSNSATTMAFNAGASQIQKTVDATAAHVYVGISNGATSSFRVDGVAATGTINANTITDIAIGFDYNPWYCDKWVCAFVLIPRVLTAPELSMLEGRWKRLFGTP